MSGDLNFIIRTHLVPPGNADELLPLDMRDISDAAFELSLKRCYDT